MSYTPPPQGGYPGGYGSWGGPGAPGGPPPGYYQKPPNGVLILVLGILSVVFCGLIGPVAWVMGNTSMREIRAGIMDPREEGMVQAGRIIGMIMTIGICLLIIGYCAFFALILGLGTAASAR